MNVQEVLDELRTRVNEPCDNCDTPGKKALFHKHACPECDGVGSPAAVPVDRDDLIALLDAASPLRSIQGLTPEEKARDRISLAIIKVRCARNDLDQGHGDYGTCEAILLLLRDLQRRLS